MKRNLKFICLIVMCYFVSISHVFALEVTSNLTLTENITNGIHVPSGANVRINLNGYKVTGYVTTTNTSGESREAAIVNEGTLIIEGSGTVEGSDGKYTVLNRNGKLTINGGNYTNTSTITSTSGPSLISNGWYNGEENTTGAYSELIINGGSFTGGLNNVKNDEYGKLTINGGTYSEGANVSILTGGKDFTMTNGNIDKKIYVQIMGADTEKTFKLTGGTFGEKFAIQFASDDKTKTNVYKNIEISDVNIYTLVINAIKTNNVTIKNVNSTSSISYSGTGEATISNCNANRLSTNTTAKVTVNNSKFTIANPSNNEEIILNNVKVTEKLYGSQTKTNIIINSGEYKLIQTYSQDNKKVGAKVIINDGTFETLHANSTGTLIVNDGTITGNIEAINVGTTVEINGGKIEGELVIDETKVPTVTIKGGKFTTEPSDSYIAEGYIKVDTASNDTIVIKESDIKTKVFVDTISEDDITDTDKELIENKIKDKYTLGAYYDIINAKITPENIVIEYVEETTNKVKVTLSIPKNLPEVKDGYTRKYVIVRLHEGQVDLITPTDNGNGTLSFETDKFSTYAIAYTDNIQQKTNTTTASNPKTKDNIKIYLTILLVSIVGIICISIINRKKKNNID